MPHRTSRPSRTPRFSRTSTILAGVVLLLLAGCAGVITHPRVSTGYSLAAFNYAVAQGRIATVVHGNPFAMAKPAFDEAVTTAMYGRHFGPDVPFTTDPGPDYRSPYFVAWHFDAAPGEAFVCSRPPAQASPAAQMRAGVQATAAFCSVYGPMTIVRGTAPATGPADPAFQQLIAQITVQLFPNFDPNRGSPTDWDL